MILNILPVSLARLAKHLKRLEHFLSKPVTGFNTEQVDLLVERCHAPEAAIERVSALP